MAINMLMNFICFIFCKLLRIRKGRQPSDCLFSTLVPPSNLTQNKQEQFTPSGREPSELLAPCVSEFGGFV